jgi:flagellar basal-body rod protein FlgB
MAGITLEDTATKALYAAMNGLSTRQRVIGDNLANINTPGFKASDVSFAQQLDKVTSAGSELQLVTTNPDHQGLAGSSGSVEITTKKDTSQRVDGNNVDAEREMESLSETVLHFEAATRITARRLSTLKTVINGGR